MRSVFLFISLALTLFANVNPFIIYNLNNLKNQNILQEMPEEQLIQANKVKENTFSLSPVTALSLILKPFEGVYLQSEDIKQGELRAEGSFDTRVFFELRVKQEDLQNYKLYNDSNKNLMLRLTSIKEGNVSIHLQPNVSFLNTLPAKEISLKDKSTRTYFRGKSLENYYHFKKAKKISLKLHGPVVFSLKVRTALNETQALRPYRQRVRVGVDDKIEVLESLKGLSQVHIHEEGRDKYLTYATGQFFSLGEGEHNITIQTYDDVLLSGSVYTHEVLNPYNVSHLQWTSPQNFTEVNNARWSNVNINDGLKKSISITSNKEKMHDALVKKALSSASGVSTVMRASFASRTPENTNIMQANYAPYSVYTQDELDEVNKTLAKEPSLVDIASIKEGVFYSLSENDFEQKQQRHQFSLQKLYFKTRQHVLDRNLKRQLSKIISKLKDYTSLEVHGFTDTAGKTQMNEKLSLQRCESVKKEMIKLGVSEQKIKLYPQGESLGDVQTSDEVHEISNRRVEIRVLQEGLANKSLVYTFKQALPFKTKFELNILGEDLKDKDIIMRIDNNESLRFHYTYDPVIQGFSYSKALKAVKALEDNEDIDISSFLSKFNNKPEIPFSDNTGRVEFYLEKGVKEVSFTLGEGSSHLKLALSQEQNANYQDTQYSLSHDYNGSYRRFYNSLEQDLSTYTDFDPWFEQTHALRVWILSRISTASLGINAQKIPEEKDMSYAQSLLEKKDYFTALQIAKHALILSPDALIQKQAYTFLQKQAKSTDELLLWHSVYFSKTASWQALKEISILLEEQGHLELALSALILLDRDGFYEKKASALAFELKMNKLSQSFNDKRYSKVKKISSKVESFHKHDMSIKRSAGISHVHSKVRNKTQEYHKASWKQPVDLELVGPVQVKIDARILSASQNYEWMRIEHNDKVYNYPLMKFRASPGLHVLPDESNISLSNTLTLDLAEGKHHFRIFGYFKELALSIKTRKLDSEVIESLDKQILQTSDFDADAWVKKIPETSLVYASALLWNYENSIFQHRYHAQSQALILQESAQDPLVKSIMQKISQDSSFSLYPSLSTDLGFYDFKLSKWVPNSIFQQNRAPLLPEVNTYSSVLTGSDNKLVHVQGNQVFKIQIKQIQPDFLRYTPASFAVSLDDGPEEVFEYSFKDEILNKEFQLPFGTHSIKIRLLNPESTHYVGINFFEDGKKIQSKSKERFFISSKSDPIMIHEKGPKLLRIQSRLSSGERANKYVYLADEKVYHYALLPENNQSEGLMRVFKLEFDALKKESKAFVPKIEQSLAFVDKDRPDQNYPRQDLQEANLQGYDITCSLELALGSQELSSEDNPDPLVKNVVEIGEYCRKKLFKDTYVRQHYYTRLYDDNFIGLKHKVYTKVPHEDIWARFEANVYLQDKDYLFNNVHLKAEVFKKEKLWPQTRHEYGLSLFKYFLDYDNSSKTGLDPLVYSNYKKNHLHGLDIFYDIYHKAYDDTEFALESNLRLNEEMSSVDNIKVKPSIRHLVYPYYLSAYFDARYYFKDDDRDDGYSINRIGAKLRYDKFFSNERLVLQAEFSHQIENKQTLFSVSLIWHFSKNKAYYNFMPDENTFKNLRQRLEDE